MTTQQNLQENPANAVNELTRYDRQIRIWGEDGQRRLSNAKISVIGDGNLSKNLLIPLSALGVGQIRVFGNTFTNKNERFLDIKMREGELKVHNFKKAIKKINPNVEVISVPFKLENRIPTSFMEGTSLVIDTTNDPRSKAIALEHAQRYGKTSISASVGESFAKMHPLEHYGKLELSHLMPNYENHEQDSLVSLFWGGVLAEETKKIILRDKDNVVFDPVYYKLGNNENKFDFLEDGEEIIQRVPRADYKDKSALVVGAGALGNFIVMGLSDLGFGRVDYIDYDTVESHNLNRQVLFHDAVGLEKSTVLARKHNRMNPNSKARGIVRKLTFEDGEYSIQDLQDEQNYDVAFDLVDNVYARALMSGFSVMNSIPLVSAGSSPYAAQVSSHVPNLTACKNHVFRNFYQRALRIEEARRRSCIDEPDPSVIITNQVASGLAALEARTIFESENFDVPFNGFLKYDTEKPFRLGATQIDSKCRCYSRKNVPNLEMNVPDIGEEILEVAK